VLFCIADGINIPYRRIGINCSMLLQREFGIWWEMQPNQSCYSNTDGRNIKSEQRSKHQQQQRIKVNQRHISSGCPTQYGVWKSAYSQSPGLNFDKGFQCQKKAPSRVFITAYPHVGKQGTSSH
jgi:hypothetical protein